MSHSTLSVACRQDKIWLIRFDGGKFLGSSLAVLKASSRACLLAVLLCLKLGIRETDTVQRRIVRALSFFRDPLQQKAEMSAFGGQMILSIASYVC